MSKKNVILGLCMAILSSSVVEVKCMDENYYRDNSAWLSADTASAAIKDSIPSKEILMRMIYSAVYDVAFVPVIYDAVRIGNYDFTADDIVGIIDTLAIYGQSEDNGDGDSAVILAELFWPYVNDFNIPMARLSEALSDAEWNNEYGRNRMIDFLRSHGVHNM
ncbi:MAG: hypothetical protein LBB12_04185 [Holosporaceae bacterium]|nr:hypothetical protein [Holosporaceae bacterium]